MRSFTESYLSDTDSPVPFENTTQINQNKKDKIKKTQRGDQKRMHPRDLRINEITYSRGVAKCP